MNDRLIRYSYDTYPSDLFDPREFVSYYRAKAGKEIDFILNRNSHLYPIEVKYRRKATICYPFAPSGEAWCSRGTPWT